MAYAVPDLTTFTFTDPSVERFAKSMISAIENNQAAIDVFVTELGRNPFTALERSLSAKLAAARLRTAQQNLELALDSLEHGADKTWAYIGADLRDRLTDVVLYAASNPPRSTCVESNDMARFELQANAELLERLTKGRF